MAAKQVDLLRMRIGSGPSITGAITRPNISFLDTPFGPLRIRDSGGRLPSVLFACDGPNVLEHYDAVFSLLSPSYRLICFEMPGFGFSYPSQTFDFSIRKYVDVVVHLIEKLNPGLATLMFPCAWSYVAFQLAAEQPIMIERLIVSQCPCWDEEQAWTKRVDANGMIRTPVVGQLMLAINQKRISDGWYRAALPKGHATDEFARPARKVLSNGGIFCLASLMQTWSHEHPSFLVEQPTVVMWGGSDRTHKRSNSNSVLKYLARGMVVTYNETGHFPELEDPERFLALLKNEELWSRLKMKETDPKLDGTIGVGGHTSGKAAGRKPFVSHL
jgi:pimeloyl-ACP methyl ester carboxylesterase